MKTWPMVLLAAALGGCDSPRIPPENPTLEFEVRSDWARIIAVHRENGGEDGRTGIADLRPAARAVAGYRPECGHLPDGRRVLVAEGVRFPDPDVAPAEARRRFDYLWSRAGC